VDAAVAAAREAYEKGPWRTMPGAKRGALMLKLADLLEANLEKVAKAESKAMGQPMAIAAGGVIPSAIACWRYYAGWADKVEGQTFPEEGGAFRYTVYEPYGVCAGIGPWNVSLS
jgi:aldehyde dehydrogenase (NAD+)